VNASQDRRCQHRDHQRCDTRKQSAGMGSGSRTASRHSASKTIAASRDGRQSGPLFFCSSALTVPYVLLALSLGIGFISD